MKPPADIGLAARVFSWMAAGLWFAVLILDLNQARSWKCLIDLVMMAQLLYTLHAAIQDRISLWAAANLNVACSYLGIVLSALVDGSQHPVGCWFFLLLPLASMPFLSPLNASLWGVLACLGPWLVHQLLPLVPWPGEGCSYPWDYWLSQLLVGGGATAFAVISCWLLKRQAARLKVSRDEALQASATKDRFLAIVSHEIRTPLNAVVATVSLLRPELESSEEQRQLWHSLEHSCHHLHSLVNDILDFSALNGGHLRLRPAAFDPVQLSAEICALFRSRAQEKGLQFLTSWPQGPPPYYGGDPVRIGQILANLVSNSLRFTDEGHIKVELELEPQGLTWRVSDSGCGIAPEHQSLIFQAFRQVDTSPSRRVQGTGLGLSISSALVELMQGGIRLSSQEGVGSRFEVRLPLRQVPQPPPPPPRVHLWRDNLSVLVIEDNPINQKVFASMLKRLGVHFQVAESGRQALDHLHHPFDLVLCDLHMPEMDGWQTTQAIRERGLSMPIVALTADSSESSRISILQAGANDCLFKPLKLAELAASLEKFCPRG